MQAYSSWTTNETIGHEMIRNLGVATICVIIVNALMLADFKLCFMVFLCVLFTLIDVTGMDIKKRYLSEIDFNSLQFV